MKLSGETVAIMSNFAQINTNLVINPGKSFSTISVAQDVVAQYTGGDDFDKKVSIFNMAELLGVLSAFDDPDLSLGTDELTISEGKQKVKYVYAAENLLTTLKKTVNMPKVDVSFTLTEEQLERIKKMANILSVDDLSFIGSNGTIIARVHDAVNSTGNSFDLDLDVSCSDDFSVHIKVEKINKLYSGKYDVEVTEKISKFSNSSTDLVYYLAIESDSSFN